MTVPNALTLSRFFMAAVLMALLYLEFPFSKTLALTVFVIAALTDWLDGRLARNVYGVTPFGSLLDPLADKVLVCAALVSFVEIRVPGATRPIIPAWIAVLILSREFLVTGLRVLAGQQGRHIPAGAWGKHKTIWQLVVIIAVLSGLVLQQDILPRVAPGVLDVFSHYFAATAYVLALGMATITVISGAVYFREHRDLFDAHMGP